MGKYFMATISKLDADKKWLLVGLRAVRLAYGTILICLYGVVQNWRYYQVAPFSFKAAALRPITISWIFGCIGDIIKKKKQG